MRSSACGRSSSRRGRDGPSRQKGRLRCGWPRSAHSYPDPRMRAFPTVSLQEELLALRRGQRARHDGAGVLDKCCDGREHTPYSGRAVLGCGQHPRPGSVKHRSYDWPSGGLGRYGADCGMRLRQSLLLRRLEARWGAHHNRPPGTPRGSGMRMALATDLPTNRHKSDWQIS